MISPVRPVRVTVLAGGVGGARMARGFASCPDLEVTIVVNVGDDDYFHGLKVCPDLDTVLYTLAGVVSGPQGWGVNGDSKKGLEVLRTLGAPNAWMQLGDADLGLHIHRTDRLRRGERLTDVTRHLASSFGVTATLLPACDADCPTVVKTDEGDLRFQEWFVRAQSAPRLCALDFSASKQSAISDEVRHALVTADLIVIAPSNPFLSIDPMLAIGGMRHLLENASASRVAVSPMIGGRAVKGPLLKVMSDLGYPPNNESILSRYRDLIDAYVVDDSDRGQVPSLVAASAVEILALPTLITEAIQAKRLAENLVSWASKAP